MHGEQHVVTSVFDRAFSVAVDQDGTLLGLGCGNATDIHQGFDDIVKGVHIVVV